MSRNIKEEMLLLTKSLVQQVTGYEESSDKFQELYKQTVQRLKKADTMCFVNRRDIDTAIDGMLQKFRFHGCEPQAQSLERAYHRYVPRDISKSDLDVRLNVVKLLLCLSDRPTTRFWEHPEMFVPTEEPREKIVDWGKYLTEGLDGYRCRHEDDESSWSENSSGVSSDLDETRQAERSSQLPLMISHTSQSEVVMDFRANREELMNTIQHSWYNKAHFRMLPYSDWADANLGLLWEEYLKDTVKGLLPLKTSSNITEYLVIREVLWQLFGSHESTVFGFRGNSLVPKSRISISSVRAVTFQHYMYRFIPYIEILDQFRDFEELLYSDDDSATSETYKSYFNGIKEIIQPIYFELSTLEDRAREQETTMTLIVLTNELERIFEPLLILKKIHEELVGNFSFKSNREAALDLLYSLHKSLRYSYAKIEHDIKLFLYLKTLFYYLHTIDCWLMKNDFADYTDEFVIKRNKSLRLWEMDYVLKEDINLTILEDKILKIVCINVLEIGRSLCLLRQLGKYNLTPHEDSYLGSNETIYEECVRRVVEKLKEYYDYEEPEIMAEDEKSSSEEILNRNDFVTLANSDKGFLMKAFESYFSDTDHKKKSEKCSLFDTISKITKTLFPTELFFEDIFIGILKERFTISGLMVKDILVENYKLKKLFDFLRYIFLFSDDMIFPFCRRLFLQINSSGKNWGNTVRLTSHLWDILMDAFPDFYEKCNVEVKEHYRSSNNIMSSLHLISIRCSIEWPLDIIVTEHHLGLYQDLFKVLLKMKWGLYTLNGLSFKDIEPPKSKKRPSKAYMGTISRLKYLRFCLLSAINSIQHYVFGFIYNKCLVKFELDFEKANDLKSLMMSHSDFVISLHAAVLEVFEAKKERNGINSILDCIQMLNTMWNDTQKATNERLNECHNLYKQCHKVIDAVLNPVYFLNY